MTIGEDAPARLDKALAAAVPEKAALSRSRLMRMIGEGAVSRGGVVVTNPKEKVAPGEVWDIRLSPATEADLRPEAIALAVVHEDADLIVTESLSGKGLSSARLATIEKYIACHLIVQLSERGGLTSSQNGESKDTYTPLSAMGNAKINGFALTRYGQQAMILDTTGTLMEMSNPMKKAQFRVIGDAESNGLPT